ncbi:bifunctional transcriptional activator/DNA repair enzyme AdaA [Paenibacillus filicis]|uniref:Bifunctional transcriptional activator/DNA repair enzyme AdaA n=1 Tax=Paenibacillus gyeongsangnamensis TaxID=3388067 RepID=A0ABT4Q4F5_9BACL|nr:bifunctional transcriptional activator/DNA repair enzyme AdaA [Paenibacillus filicis]MCZ8511767.1 bifunctional transcriptional activator/DNA repair enzyme AdaA [Paenibacillus filicis]
MREPEPVTDEQWQAIISNDAAYDNQFFYAVTTTGIFCRPSCKSKPPKKENIGLFRTAEQAMAAKFRPCKRCKPTGGRLPDDEWVALATEYIDKNYMENVSLNLLAASCHGSPYHLHRTFKKIKGITPAEYIRHRRIERAKELLLKTANAVAEVGLSVGLPNTPYFITLFKKKTGCTPAAYRQIRNQHLSEAADHGKPN